MKPHLTSILLALITIPSVACTAYADVIGGGVFYDVGKYSFSSDSPRQMPEGATITSDEWYCWAAAASNTVQYWQDFYYGNFDEGKTVPNGIAESNVYSDPAGTTYISVYQEALKRGERDTPGNPEDFYAWWVKGGVVDGALGEKPAYYGTLFTDVETPTSTITGVEWGAGPSLAQLTEFITNAFATEGQAVSLTISGTASHAISCWGYELDDNNQLSSLLLTCSDDKRFTVFRVDVQERDCYSDMSGEGVLMGFKNQVSLLTDEEAGYYGHDWSWITAACVLQTPAKAKVDGDAPILQKSIPENRVVRENTSLSENTAIKGNGVVVGDLDEAGKAKNVVVLTSTASLSLMGSDTETKNEGTGLKIADGGTVSLKGLSVEKYADGGVDATGRLYLRDGDVTISNNANSDNGGGINNTSYVEISKGGKIIFENNAATGEGGAISNVNPNPVPEDIDRLHYLVRGEAYYSGWKTPEPNYTSVSIRGNNEVVFKGNSATAVDGGNDIYNGKSAVVNIADNGNVRFEGTNNSVAVRNEGYLFMSAETGKSIDFVDSSLLSVGDTAIGMDVSGRTTDAAGSVNFYDASMNKQLSLSSRHGLGGVKDVFEDEESGVLFATRDYTVPSLLSNVSVNVDEIVGLGDGASVTDTLIQTNGPLAIKNLTMNASDAIISTGMDDVALDTVVFDLTGVEIGEGNVVDLTQMLTGNFTFSEVQFLMDGKVDSEVLEKITFDLSKAYTKADEARIKDQVKLYAVQQGRLVELKTDNVTFMFAEERIPEPTTGTLSLLALAALAARRRRK